ncbi:hypothetical protein BKA67DRAFT_587860 [Truncatella angustata]|uniref:Uncharacterized protein n=1 Tax=Truncatella angustata TaxID=152316 RepID=A0A9P8RHK5_9PEZI|nr:uncharacterized protein BKA67DRAFT_587860 [Truncatella angustata]KAH6639913.1 hypothetical protein BKA67DRAFT_587860 [Truncatella angustata]
MEPINRLPFARCQKQNGALLTCIGADSLEMLTSATCLSGAIFELTRIKFTALIQLQSYHSLSEGPN